MGVRDRAPFITMLRAAITFIALVALASSASAYSITGFPAGCIANAPLSPYTGSYNGSAFFFNNATVDWNSPQLLFNGKGSLAFNAVVSTGDASVIGRLPDDVDFEGLSNSDAFDLAEAYNYYQENTTPGATYYVIQSASGAVTAQYVFKVKDMLANGDVEIDIAAFVINTTDRSSTGCVYSDRQATIVGRCGDQVVMSNSCPTSSSKTGAARPFQNVRL